MSKDCIEMFGHSNEAIRGELIPMGTTFVRSLRANGMLYFALQGAGIASLLLLTRIVGPEQLAAWILWFNLVAVLASVGALRYELGVVTACSDDEAAALLVGASVIAIFLGSLMFIAITIWATLVSNSSNLAPIAFAAAAGSCAAISQAIAAWQLRKSRVATHTFLIMSPPLVASGAQILLALCGKSEPIWLVFGGFCGYTLPALLGCALVWAKDRLWFTSLDTKTIRASIWEYRRFPKYSVPFTAAVLLRERAIYGILGLVGDAAAISLFGLSHRLVNLANAVVSSPLRPVFFQFAARSGMPAAKVHVQWLLKAISAAVVPTWTAVLVWAPEVLRQVLGSEWEGAAPYLRILSVPFFIIAISGWLDRIYDVMNDQRRIFQMEAVFSILMVASLGAGLVFSRNTLYLTGIVAVVTLAYGWIWLAMTYHWLELPARGFVAIVALHLAASMSVVLVHALAESLSGSVPALAAVALVVAAFATYSLRTAKRHLPLIRQG